MFSAQCFQQALRDITVKCRSLEEQLISIRHNDGEKDFRLKDLEYSKRTLEQEIQNLRLQVKTGWKDKMPCPHSKDVGATATSWGVEGFRLIGGAGQDVLALRFEFRHPSSKHLVPSSPFYFHTTPVRLVSTWPIAK